MNDLSLRFRISFLASTKSSRSATCASSQNASAGSVAASVAVVLSLTLAQQLPLAHVRGPLNRLEQLVAAHGVVEIGLGGGPTTNRLAEAAE